MAAALLKDPKYKVRAVSRDPESDKARALTDQGKLNLFKCYFILIRFNLAYFSSIKFNSIAFNSVPSN